MKKHTRFMLLVMALVAPLSGCMTMMYDARDERVQINSSPQGATVAIEGHEVGQTPLVVDLRTRDAGYALEITHPQCEPFKGRIVAEKDSDRIESAWIWGIFWTGPFEMISMTEDGIFRDLADQSISLQCEGP